MQMKDDVKDLQAKWDEAVAAREPLIDELKRHHRRRRFAIKNQQKIDRALESFIRVYATEWDPDMNDKERDKINAEVKAIIKKIRDGIDYGHCEACGQLTMKVREESEFTDIVCTADAAREPADLMRERSQKPMEKIAEQLGAHAWTQSVHGVGEIGLANIVAEAGELGDYPNLYKLYSRLGFAPYEGLAGSTWKRESWRPRALTKEEWTDHPFSGQRYAFMHQTAVWLVNAQVESAEKSGTEFGRPKGPFGKIYVERREETKAKHPDWTRQHARMDALRITMKEFLKALYFEWNKDRPLVEGLPPPKTLGQQVQRAKNPPKKKNAPRKRR
jgi:RNA polymerase-binding transcription factor DksA